MSIDEGAFAGWHVLDRSQGFAGALCAMILGDNGASVVRIEDAGQPPEDDPLRALAGHRMWRRSSQVLRLPGADDPGSGTTPAASDAGRAEAARLEDEADIVLDSGAAGRDRLAALRARRPDVITCLFDAFGDHPTLGHLPAYDATVMAASGRMLDLGRMFRWDRPAWTAPPLPSYGAATQAVTAIAAAWRERERTGAGASIRASLSRGLTIFDFWGPDGSTSPAPPPPPAHLGPNPMLGYTPARTADGKWIQWANWAPHLLWGMLGTLGLGHLKDDPRFARLPQGAPEDVHEAWELVLTATASKTADEWMRILTASGAAGGDVMTETVDGMDHPQARHNGNVVAVRDAEVGDTEQLGPVGAFGATPGRIGVHEWTGSGRASVAGSAAPAAPAAPPRRPLEGVVVLEAANMIATPVGGLMLADLGARVIHIEPVEGEAGRALPFDKTLLGKEGLAVDLRHPDGLAVVHRLTQHADVFLHNMRPGVPEKLGIDADTLRGLNPQLVYCYAGAYGKTGPYAKMPAYHPIAGGICGNAVRQAGRGALDAPVDDMASRKAASLRLFQANEGHPDPVTGALAAAVMLIGLVARDRTGEGQELTTTMLGASAYLMSADWIRYDGRPDALALDPGLHGTSARRRLYRCADGWVHLECPTAPEWRRFVDVAGIDVTGIDVAGVADDDALASALEAWFAGQRADDVESRCLAAGVACVRADRGGFCEWQHAEVLAGRRHGAAEVPATAPATGSRWRAGPVVDMDGVGAVGGACRIGEHTRSILAEIGYGADEIDDLFARGVVGG
jgi:crotonobetainyl-CoA:carnitine CoA-transferase CaiB-like acyl-CoA transferase